MTPPPAPAVDQPPHAYHAPARAHRRAACRDSDGDAMSALQQPQLPTTSEPREWSDTRVTPESPVSERPTVGAMFREILPLIGAIPVAGPPGILLAGPWILLALLLAGPVALLVTVVIVLLVAALLVVALAVIPCLLVRHLRAAWARHATSRTLVEPRPGNSPAAAGRPRLPRSVAPGF
jgi:hypothetical protein